MSRSLRQQLDDVADVRWWHPGWWALIWGTRCLAASGAARTTAHQQLYRRANGGPDSDTFMARATPIARRVPAGDLAAVVARSVVGAAAAIERLDWLQSRQPLQALQAVVGWNNGWLEPHRLTADEVRTALFVVPGGVYRAMVESGSLFALAGCLASVAADEVTLPPGRFEPVDTATAAAMRAAVVVSLLPQRIPDARHLHRSAWSRGGGPWLGVGFAEELDVVSTCHLGVDGFGHALLTDGICSRIADQAPALAQRLRAADDRWCVAHGDAAYDSSAPDPLGFATRELPDGAGRFAEQAYAMGRALGRFFGFDRGRESESLPRFSPTFQVPVAPATCRGELLRDADVFHGLLSVRMRQGSFESFESFAARLPEWNRARAARRRRAYPNRVGDRRLGAATGSEATVAAQPQGAEPHLASGRGSLRPRAIIELALSGRRAALGTGLCGVGAGLVAERRRSPRRGCMTLIHHQAGCTVSALGSGLASTSAGAEAFLEIWLEELARSMAAASSPW